jgi:hypothetical protein
MPIRCQSSTAAQLTQMNIPCGPKLNKNETLMSTESAPSLPKQPQPTIALNKIRHELDRSASRGGTLPSGTCN